MEQNYGKILSAFKENFRAGSIGDQILELPDIQNAEIVDGKVRVETKDNVFVDVMSTVVNIFSRVAGGCELSFVGFAYRD